ncbi:hypothetical protein [Phaffia rhodozyma]|uniref:Uncharacterized protein n=1 Tax=Phaffia rhodozyma TaxID=264483 RepID=A0A0F7SEC8_PHARH|nr:hypothetical protein [Phaffia rhodozyma]
MADLGYQSLRWWESHRNSPGIEPSTLGQPTIQLAIWPIVPLLVVYKSSIGQDERLNIICSSHTYTRSTSLISVLKLLSCRLSTIKLTVQALLI